MNQIKWIVLGIVLTIGLGVGGYCYFQRKDLVKKEVKLEIEFAADTASYARDTLETDKAIEADSAKPKTRKAVAAERQSCVKALNTCGKRVQNLQKQLHGGWLKVFGEVNYQFPHQKPLLKGDLNAEIGLMVRMLQGLSVQGWVQQPLTGSPRERRYNIGFRQEFRLY